MKKKLHPVHPGEVLLEEFLKPMGLSQNRLALNIGVPGRRINEIVLGRRAVTADTALRLSRFFGVSAEFWLGLQAQYDLDLAVEELGGRLEAEVRTCQDDIVGIARSGLRDGSSRHDAYLYGKDE
jgi:antitoxin HigA-1